MIILTEVTVVIMQAYMIILIDDYFEMIILILSWDDDLGEDDYLDRGDGGDYAGRRIEVWWGMATVTAGRDTHAEQSYKIF